MSEMQEKWDDLFGRIAETVERWRQEHPEATLTEIEEAVGGRIAEVRTQMVEDLAHQGRTADLKRVPKEARPRCPQCGEPVIANGKQKRRLITDYEQHIDLERSKAYCTHCQVSFFPSG